MKQRNLRTFTLETRQGPIKDKNNRELVPARNISLKSFLSICLELWPLYAMYLAKIAYECFILSYGFVSEMESLDVVIFEKIWSRLFLKRPVSIQLAWYQLNKEEKIYISFY